MPAIAVQSAVGETGRKPVTTIPWCNFSSMAVVNGMPIGASDEGLFLLDAGETNNGTAYTRSVTFATTDFGAIEPKWGRFLYIGIDVATTDTITVKVKADEQTESTYTATTKKTGLQRIRVPLSRKVTAQGRYLRVTIEAQSWFRIERVDMEIIKRNKGIVGY